MKAFRLSDIQEIPQGLSGAALRAATEARAKAVKWRERLAACEIRHMEPPAAGSGSCHYSTTAANASDYSEMLADVSEARRLADEFRKTEFRKRYVFSGSFHYHGDRMDVSAIHKIEAFILSMEEAGVPVCDGEIEAKLAGLIAIGA